MPFFCTANIRVGYNPFPLTNEQPAAAIDVFCELPFDEKTLQVRIPRKLSAGRKRVSFSASASMTVEAALVLPLFLFAGILLMTPFRIMDVERQMQAIVMAVGEEISQTAYLSVDSGEMPAETLSVAYAEAAVRSRAAGLPVHGLSLAGSSLLEDGETIDLVAVYRIPMPFSMFGLDASERMNRCYLRAWVGRDTGADSGGAGDGEEDDPIVYVGRDSTRYHVSASCHYLSNRLTAVSLEEVGNCRNGSGSRYTPCTRCGGNVSGTVYIMTSGEHYHSSRTCSAILAYVRAVRKSTVEYLGACSYCSGG